MGTPDKVFPHATGEALKTVNKHSQPQDLVFYSGWFCPYVQRTWIALEEKGIAYEYKEVDPYRKEKHFLDINPKGLVPAVEYHGKPLYESLILCEFLEDAFPSTPRLLPADPFARAHSRLWMDHISKAIASAFIRLLQAQDPDKQTAALQEYYKALRILADQVKAPYFGGEDWGLVDTAVAPWIARDFVVEKHRGFKRENVGRNWEEYAKRVESRESVLRTMSDRERVEQNIRRYLRDEAQSEAAKAVRAGRPVP
ncbi:glutathione S-transferase [Auriscalpium vulgare]|uniref:Glutathione S-transferase n=1 Tax=Auriscalpium vulgare TaxID=40419 RepID=A0ACB8S403_9AGAM|nr:glutathione S-transferase [Auriscalpium vulgare]